MTTNISQKTFFEKYLKRKKLKQKDLIIPTGLNKSTISRVINGEITPSLTSYEKICNAIGIPESKKILFLKVLTKTHKK